MMTSEVEVLPEAKKQLAERANELAAREEALATRPPGTVAAAEVGASATVSLACIAKERTPALSGCIMGSTM